MPKPKGMAPIIYILLGLIAAVLGTLVVTQVVGAGATITKTVTTTVTTTAPITPTTPPQTTPPPATTVPPITTTVTTTTTITLTPRGPILGPPPLPCQVWIVVNETNAVMVGNQVIADGNFYIKVKVIRTGAGCNSTLAAMTSGGVQLLSGGPYQVPGNPGTYGPYTFQFSATAPGTIVFYITPIQTPGTICSEPCQVHRLGLSVTPCNVTLTFAGTDAQPAGGNMVYYAYSGGQYRIWVNVAGPQLPQYAVRLDQVPSVNPTGADVLSPNPYIGPIPQTVEFVIRFPATALGTYATAFTGWIPFAFETPEGGRYCRREAKGPIFIVRPPPCGISISLLDTNATGQPGVAAQRYGNFRGGYFVYREGGNETYRFLLYINASWLHLPLRLRFQWVNGTDAGQQNATTQRYGNFRGGIFVYKYAGGYFVPQKYTGGYFIYGGVNGSLECSGPSCELLLPPPDPAGPANLTVEVLVRPPGPGNLTVEAAVGYGARPNCTAVAVLAFRPEVKPPECKVWLNVPPQLTIWVDGSGNYLPVSFPIWIRSSPMGLMASLTLYPPMGILAGASPSNGLTDFQSTVQLLVPQNMQGVYQLGYAVSANWEALPIGAKPCYARNVTLLNITRCRWDIKVLNSTPLQLEVGRTYTLAVYVDGAPFPAELQAASSDPALQVTPQFNNPITQPGTYYFSVKANAEGSFGLEISVVSERFRNCRSAVKVEVVVKGAIQACRPTLRIATNMSQVIPPDMPGFVYGVYPGGRYWFRAEVGGSLPYGLYRLMAFLLNIPVSQWSPDPAKYDFPVDQSHPLPQYFDFYFVVSPDAQPGTGGTLRLMLAQLNAGTAAPPCNASASWPVRVLEPPCAVRMSIVRTNATLVNGTYRMAAGLTYEFTVGLYVGWAYRPMRLRLDAPNAQVTADGYSTTPQVPVSPNSGNGFGWFDIGPPTPAGPLSGTFTFYVRPTVGTDVIALSYSDDRGCSSKQSYPAKVEG